MFNTNDIYIIYLIYFVHVFLSETLIRSFVSKVNCSLYKSFTAVIIPTYFNNSLGFNKKRNLKKAVSSSVYNIFYSY